ncbi:hypothetical protein ACG2F4_19290 [Halalkalibaculum sp. DA3122]|uniref:hypothetical protein n=1 Tax=Halalkalibaculum sp. DA3122 TaxID=3373607 RepID=UPI003754242B
MSYLILLPWLRIGGTYRLGEFELGTLQVEEPERFDIDPELLRDALDPFRVNRELPIKKFTYVCKGDQLLNNYSEAELDKFSLFHEILVISGLANRQFFNPFLYCNTDQFDYYIRNLNDEDNFVTISGRRRDGNTQNFISDEALIVVRQPHIPSKPIPFQLNQNLIHSLIEASQELRDRDWGKIYNSILSFNRSNTDNAKISQVQEIILMRSAFEQLISDRNLTDDFETLLSGYVDLKSIGEYPDLFQRESDEEVEEESSISSVWMDEFTRIRNIVAHGHDISDRNFRWPLREHLLLGSFIYPVILKTKLREHGICELTDYDMIYFRAFEELCTKRHLIDYGDEIYEPGFRFPWNEIWGQYFFEYQWNRMVGNSD